MATERENDGFENGGSETNESIVENSENINSVTDEQEVEVTASCDNAETESEKPDSEINGSEIKDNVNAESNTVESEIEKSDNSSTEEDKDDKKKKKPLALRILQIAGFALLTVVLVLLTINSMLCVFVKHYYPTYGQYRLFAIVSDSMEGDGEDNIPTGSMIVDRVPKSSDEIEVGTIITYEYTQGNSIVLITHRVIEIHVDEETGVISYTTKGDNVNRADGVRPTFDDVVGIYTGNKCGFFGYFFGFLQAPEGAITLIIILLIIVATMIIVHFINLVNIWRSVALSALKKSADILNAISNIEELGTLADVIGIVSKDPEGKSDIKRKDDKLNWFIEMSALPKRPYPDDLEEYLRLMGDSLKPVPVPRLKYADDEDVQLVIKEVYVDRPVEQVVEQPVEEEQLEIEELNEEVVEEVAPVEEVVAEPEPEVVEEEIPAEEPEPEPEIVEEAVEEEEIHTVAEVLEEPEEEIVEEQAEEVIVEEETPVEEPVYEEPAQILTVEQILSEAEEEPEDEEPEFEILPEEDEPLEEVRSVDKLTGMAIIVRYKKSFTAKLIQSDDKTKAYYSMLKNALLSYNKVKNRISWNHENFNFGRNNIARFSIRGKSLCIYFALDPNDYADSKYKVEYAESKKYENIPCMYRIKNARRAKYALDLIAALAEKFGLEKGEDQRVNYYLHYEPTQPLIERGLIKELVSEEDYYEFMRQYSRKEVSRKRRESVSAKDVNSVITDDVAIALVEDKREENASANVKTKAVGKKGIINVDTLSDNFEKNETVNLESLKQKGLIAKNVSNLKVLARGTLTKPLNVEAQDFSIEAIKMIVLTGGKATKV